MVEMKKGTLTKEVKVEYDKLAMELEILSHDQAMYWKQRGKATWIKDGDKKISFFHVKTSIRQSVNKITGLRNGVRTWVTEKAQMESVVHEYFMGIFRFADQNKGGIWIRFCLLLILGFLRKVRSF